MSEKFTFFWSGPFSQWHPSPFALNGVTYNCAEQYMMAEKARLFGDTAREQAIMREPEPDVQKALGRLVRNFDVDVWQAEAKRIVTEASRAKYSQNPELMRALLATAGTTIVEASPEDRIWGIGLHKTDPRARNRRTWRGTNWLGEVLTQVRDEFLSSGR